MEGGPLQVLPGKEICKKENKGGVTSRGRYVGAARHGGGLVVSEVTCPDAGADKVAQPADALAGRRTAQLVVARQRRKQRLQQCVHMPLEHLRKAQAVSGRGHL